MPSAINDLMPESGNATTASVRANFQTAKTEITTLQADKAQRAGDLGGTAASTTVIQLQGRPMLNTAPTTGQVLTWSGANWQPQTAGTGLPAGFIFRPMTPNIVDWVPPGLEGIFVSEGKDVEGAPPGEWFFTAYCSSAPPFQRAKIVAQPVQPYQMNPAVLETYGWVSGGVRYFGSWGMQGLTGNWRMVFYQANITRHIYGDPFYRSLIPWVWSGGYLGSGLTRRYIMRTNWSRPDLTYTLSDYTNSQQWPMPSVATITWVGGQESWHGMGANPTPGFYNRYTTSATRPPSFDHLPTPLAGNTNRAVYIHHNGGASVPAEVSGEIWTEQQPPYTEDQGLW